MPKSTMTARARPGGLEVPVDDLRLVQIAEGVEEIDGEVDGLFDAQDTLLQDLGEARPLDELHHEDEAEVLVVEEVDHPRDVVALHAAEQERLPLEPGDDLVVLGSRGQQALERNHLSRLLLLRGPDLPHAARAHDPGQAEAPCDAGARDEVHASATYQSSRSTPPS